MPIAAPTWVSCRRWVLVTPWGQISYAWMSSSNLCQVLCCYSNYLSYCLKVSLTQKERNSFCFILGLSSIQNVVQSPQVIKRCLRGCYENKTAIEAGEVPAFSIPHTSATRLFFSVLYLCKICLKKRSHWLLKKESKSEKLLCYLIN